MRAPLSLSALALSTFALGTVGCSRGDLGAESASLRTSEDVRCVVVQRHVKADTSRVGDGDTIEAASQLRTVEAEPCFLAAARVYEREHAAWEPLKERRGESRHYFRAVILGRDFVRLRDTLRAEISAKDAGTCLVAYRMSAGADLRFKVAAVLDVEKSSGGECPDKALEAAAELRKGNKDLVLVGAMFKFSGEEEAKPVAADNDPVPEKEPVEELVKERAKEPAEEPVEGPAEGPADLGPNP